MPKRSNDPVVTEEEFVKGCGDANTPTETLRQALAVSPDLCNASAFLEPNYRSDDIPVAKTWTALEKAAVSVKSIEKVRLLLQHGADPEVTLHGYSKRLTNTVLWWVCRDVQASLDVVKILLEYGANVNAAGTHGRTPLMAACFSGRVDIVRLLVQNGAHVNATSDQQRTPLIANCQVENCSIEVVRLLLEKGADVNAVMNADYEEECFTALVGACRNGAFEVAKLLLEHGANVDACDHANCTPLLGMCPHLGEEYRTEVMKLLLENGASPNAKRGCDCTTFFNMIGTATIEQVHILLDYGADVNAGCLRGKTLQRAIENQDWQVADLLLDRGASPHSCIVPAIRAQAEMPFLEKLMEKGACINEADGISDTALSVAAAERKDVALVQFLLDRGADVNVRGDANRSASSHYCSTPWLKVVSRKEASLEIVRLFLEMGALVNDSDSKGNTPLMLAKAVPVVKLLLEQPAVDVNAVNRNGYTALIHHTGREFRHFNYPSTEVIQELLKKDNINKNAKNGEGATALMVAVKLRRVDVVRSLLESGDDIVVNHVDNEGETALHKAVKGSNSMVPIVPPHVLVGSMAMKNNGQCLSIEGTWGVDGASINSTQETSGNRFVFKRILEIDDPTELSQLEQLGGMFVSSFDTRDGRNFVDGDIELCFSRMSTSSEDVPGSVIYRVQGFGPGISYGAVNVAGTVTLQLADPNDTHSTKVKLIKTYQHGTGESSGFLKYYCDQISRGENSVGDDCEPKQNMAVHKDNLMIAQLLLQHGIDVNRKDNSKEGNSPLMIACRDHGDDLHMAKLLVSRGASVDAQNNDGKTSLILAKEQGSLSMVKFLLQEGGGFIALKRDA